ncbi:MAG: hypothetical protein GY832_46755 [Chloroflexi bacterium]|nr:hypothetical protein [Chloroflexota bacterium]
MDKTRLFQFLSTQDSSALLGLLNIAYDQMSIDQLHAVFDQTVQALPSVPVDGEVLLGRVKAFKRRSLAGYYYEPFEINSKNWTDVPEETDEWFEELGDLLKASCQLTSQGDHLHAVACFGILYQLVDKIEDGEDIVFGDEIGSWMIPGDEKDYIATYMTSLAATATTEEFTTAALVLIRRDSWQSFVTQAYASAIRAADDAQRAHLDAEIQRQNIRTSRK